MPIQERVETIRDLTAEARDEAKRTGGMGGLSGILNQLPTSVVTRAARSTAGRIDFATSNLKGAPFDLYCAGAKVLGTIVMGPVAGTGANITALSNGDWLDLGIFLDPHAIQDPESFRNHIEAAFADMTAELKSNA